MDWTKLLSKKRTRALMSREFYTSPVGEHRTEYERDYDRAIFSTPVRRLQDKTQVFPLDPSDAVRTRLTHSMEVSAVAEGLATIVSSDLLGHGLIDEEKAGAIRSVSRTCGLIHDLGNPPFGHAGEKAISEWFEARRTELETAFVGHPHAAQLSGDFLSFEGNAQTFRLLARLQVFVEPTGLNMTSATLSTACKYIAPSHETDKAVHPRSKPGFFASENEVIARLRSETGTLGARHPLAFLVEAADDIVYSAVDIEDGVRKGIIGWEEVEASLLRLAKSDSRVVKVLDDAKRYVKGRSLNSDPKRLDEVLVQSFRTKAIAYSVPAAAAVFLRERDEVLGGRYRSELVNDPEFGPLVRACKQLARERIYSSAETLRLELMGRRVIQDLLEVFYEGIAKPQSYFGRKVWELLSKNYKEVYELDRTRTGFPVEYHNFQLLTDYIAGMTDSFALKLREYLLNG